MGVSGLLPQLRSITTKAHVSKYRGQTGVAPSGTALPPAAAGRGSLRSLPPHTPPATF